MWYLNAFKINTSYKTCHHDWHPLQMKPPFLYCEKHLICGCCIQIYIVQTRHHWKYECRFRHCNVVFVSWFYFSHMNSDTAFHCLFPDFVFFIIHTAPTLYTSLDSFTFGFRHYSAVSIFSSIFILAFGRCVILSVFWLCFFHHSHTFYTSRLMKILIFTFEFRHCKFSWFCRAYSKHFWTFFRH